MNNAQNTSTLASILVLAFFALLAYAVVSPEGFATPTTGGAQQVQEPAGGVAMEEPSDDEIIVEGEEESTSQQPQPSHLRTTLHVLPDVSDLELDLEELVKARKAQIAQEQARKAARAKFKKLDRCLVRTAKNIRTALFRKGKTYGAWTMSKALDEKSQSCRTLTYTRDNEEDVEVFEKAVKKVLARQLKNLTLHVESDEESVTIWLLTSEEKAQIRYEQAKRAKLAKLEAKKQALLKKLADEAIAQEELLGETFEDYKAKKETKGLARKLAYKGKVLWKAGLKGEAKKAWRAALKANPSRKLKKSLKSWLSL